MGDLWKLCGSSQLWEEIGEMRELGGVGGGAVCKFLISATIMCLRLWLLCGGVGARLLNIFEWWCGEIGNRGAWVGIHLSINQRLIGRPIIFMSYRAQWENKDSSIKYNGLQKLYHSHNINNLSFYMTCKLSVSIWKALFDNGRDCSSVQIERFIRSWCARPNGPKYTNGQPHLLSAIYYFPSSPLLLCTTPSINRNLKKLSPPLLRHT